MFGLETAAGVFEQRTAEQAFGLVVFNVVTAPTAAPAVGLAQFAPSAGRINRPAELGDIDKGFDHQHRMAVSALPIGGKPIQGQAQHLARQVGYGALRQDKEPAVVSHQAQAAVALCRTPSDPLVAMLEVLGWSTEDQQGQPLTLGIGGHVLEAFAHRFNASQIVVGLRGLDQKPWDDALSQHGDQTWVDRLGEDEKRRTTQSVDPVIGGASQAEPFAGHVPAWQISETTVIDAPGAVGVDEPDAVTLGAGHPLLSQTTLPLGCLTVLTAEVGDFLPQSFDL